MLSQTPHHNGQDTKPIGTDQIRDALSSIKTVSERDFFISQLQALKNYLESTGSTHPKIATHLSMRNKEAFLAICASRKIEENDVASLVHLINDLIEYLHHVPVVSLSIPVDLPDEEVETLSQWFLDHIEKKVFLSITIEKSLIAGATIASNGLYRDFSLRELNSSK